MTMSTEARTNGSEDSGQPIVLGQSAGGSKASKPFPVLKVLELELEGLSIKMVFGALEGPGDGEGDKGSGNGGSG
jgi:hypothetical protein